MAVKRKQPVQASTASQPEKKATASGIGRLSVCATSDNIRCALVSFGIILAAVAICSYPNQEGQQDVGDDGNRAAVKLLQDLRQKGAILNIVPAVFPGGLRGVAAGRALKPGDVVMELPLKDIFFEDTVSPEVRQACAALPCNISRAVITLGLAYERSLGEKSRFASFIESLPEEVTNLIGWPAPLLLLMERAMPGTRSYLSRELQELEAANTLLAKPVKVNFLIWAVGMVQSRAFGAWDGKEALMPAAGLLNHHWDPNEAIPMPTCHPAENKCFVVAGKRAIEKGQQLFFHYRPWSNLQLLIRYGFAVPGNPWGPAITIVALISPPAWLVKEGCTAGPVWLKAGQTSDEAPLPVTTLRCARAAFVANVSSEESERAQELWAKGLFNDSGAAEGAPGRQVFVEISEACAAISKKWTEPEGLELLTAVNELQYGVAQDVMQAVKNDLSILQSCEESFAR